MFESEMRNVIAESKNEVVVAIVPRAKQLARLGDQVGHSLLVFRTHVQRVFAVGHDVHLVMDRLTRGRDVDVAIVEARSNRRVHEQIKRDGLERDFVSALSCDGKGTAELPALRHDQLRLVHQLLGRRSLRIQRNFVPLEDQQLVGCRSAVRLDVIVVRFELAHARRDIEVKREHIQQVALPRNDLAVRFELEPGQAGNRPIRPMFAGNPLWVIHSQRPRFDRHHEVRMQNLVLCLGRIHGERNFLCAETQGSDDDCN